MKHKYTIKSLGSRDQFRKTQNKSNDSVNIGDGKICTNLLFNIFYVKCYYIVHT